MPIFNKTFYSLVPRGFLFIDNQISNQIAFIKFKKNLITRIYRGKPKFVSIEVEGYNLKDFDFIIRETKMKYECPLVVIHTKDKKVSITI